MNLLSWETPPQFTELGVASFASRSSLMSGLYIRNNRTTKEISPVPAIPPFTAGLEEKIT